MRRIRSSKLILYVCGSIRVIRVDLYASLVLMAQASNEKDRFAPKTAPTLNPPNYNPIDPADLAKYDGTRHWNTMYR